MNNKAKILITGACGGLAAELSRVLCDEYRLIGIDPRQPQSHIKFFGEIEVTNYRSRKVDDIFRSHNFDAFFHLGRIPVTSKVARSDRYSENVLGTRHLLQLAEEYKIPNVVVLSTYHVYGAHPHNPLYLKENDPLRATQRIPELSDAMELDHLATQFALTFKGQTIILRPTNVIGERVSNVLSKLLRLSWLPVPMGFDPPMQLLSQEDLVRALLTVLKNPQKGIYNIASPESVPLSRILELNGVKRIPIPDLLMRSALKKLPLSSVAIPPYMIDFFKFPTLIDSEKFTQTYNFEYKKSLIASLTNV